MGWIPSKDTNLQVLSCDELNSLKTLLNTEMAAAKARQDDVQGLINAIDAERAGRVPPCP